MPATSDSRPIALIPAYRPEATLPVIVQQLLQRPEFAAVVVVDDGGGPEFASVFAELARIDGVHVLRHHVNLGKGAALKTGFNWIGVSHPAAVGVVTLDADGQHAVEDVAAVARALSEQPQRLILGCRSFPSSVPLRSRVGNIATRWVMRAIGGLKVSDTQTGLRGIPFSFLPHLLRLRTTGYDFELDMLLAAKQESRGMLEVPIQTIYIDGNRSSHFNPLLDSLRIYYVFLRFNLSSLSAFLVDFSLFTVLHLAGASIAFAQFGARAVSSLFNYLVNRHFVFKSDKGRLSSLLLYYATVVLVAACSYGLILLMHEGFGISVYMAKLIADTGLYVASFAIQREFVFRRLADEQPMD